MRILLVVILTIVMMYLLAKKLYLSRKKQKMAEAENRQRIIEEGIQKDFDVLRKEMKQYLTI